MIYQNIKLKNKIFFFAHRGAPRLIHENTINSIEQAIILGCNGIETDIQPTKDNQIILFHDNYITDKMRKRHLINKLNYSEIEQICKQNDTPSPNTLDQLIKIMHIYTGVVFNLEIKSLKINNIKLIKIILEKIPKKILKNQCIISSFNCWLLFQLNFFSKEHYTALILGSKRKGGTIKTFINKIIIKVLNPHFLHPNFIHLNKSFIKWAHKNNMQVNAYTINEQKELEESKNLGVDGVFTDNHFLYNKLVK